MKKIRILSFLVILLLYTMHSSSQDINTYFYAGKGHSWLATYSLIQVGSIYYDSLYIQYLFDPIEIPHQEERIGPIEYILAGNSLEMSSSYPQDLKGVASFHTASAYNSDIIRITFDENIELTISWKNNIENFKLFKQ